MILISVLKNILQNKKSSLVRQGELDEVMLRKRYFQDQMIFPYFFLLFNQRRYFGGLNCSFFYYTFCLKNLNPLCLNLTYIFYEIYLSFFKRAAFDVYLYNMDVLKGDLFYVLDA